MNDKLQSLTRSRRFWLAIGGVAIVCADHFGFKIDPETIQNITVIVGSWIVGDSMRKTE